MTHWYKKKNETSEEEYKAQLEKLNKQQRNKRKKNAQNGLCAECNNKHLPLSKLCEIHFLKNKSKEFFKTATKWKQLKEIFENQNKKCLKTNVFLELGKNATLAFNGEIKIENAYWTTKAHRRSFLLNESSKKQTEFKVQPRELEQEFQIYYNLIEQEMKNEQK